jgi:hypothetical protein
MRKLEINQDKQPRRNKRLEILNVEDFNYKPTVISGFEKNWALIKIYADLSWLFLKKYKNPFKLWGMIQKINAKKSEVMYGNRLMKIARVDGKHYFTPVGLIGGQGWPSKHYYRNVNVLAKEYMTNDVSPSDYLGLVYMAMSGMS